MIEFEILYARKDINEEKKTIGYYLKTHMNNKKKIMPKWNVLWILRA